jgi:hypothetical protein
MSDIFFDFVENLQRIQAVEAAEKESMVTQSIIFKKDKFSISEAKKWLSKNNYKSSKVDTTDQYHRFRQRDPGDFKEGSFRTVKLTEGVSAIMGKLKN